MKRDTKVRGSALRAVVLAGTLSILAPTSILGQDLTGRWRIELHTGVGIRVNAGTTTSAQGVETTTKAAGFLGGLGLSHWFTPDLAGSASLGVLSVGTETRAGVGGVATKTALVVPFFIGVRRYLTASDAESGARLFGSLEAGPVTGHQSSSSVGSAIVVESISRTAFGARGGAGVDFRLGSRFMLAVAGGYTFMTDFSDPIGGETNHSGGDVGLTLGILLGG